MVLVGCQNIKKGYLKRNWPTDENTLLYVYGLDYGTGAGCGTSVV